MRPLVLVLLLASVAQADEYAWPHTATQTLAQRLAPPPGGVRIATRGFGAWLRGLPLLPEGAPVHLYDGTRKPRQDVHAAVVDLDVGHRDLQQCADAVMRLRAEYLYAHAQPIAFHPEPGHARALTFAGSDRPAFARYLTRVFAEAGSASLQAELHGVHGALEPGDVLIQGGYPGHAVLVLDVAEAAGKQYVLLGQSYMPAQQFHVLRNLEAPALSPWFDVATLDGAGLVTPEWRPFFRRDVRRF